MATENKMSRWNRFEIAFNEGMRPEAAACKEDWRKKWKKTERIGGLGGMEEASLAEETFGEGTPEASFAQGPSGKASPFKKKRSSAVVRNLGEEERSLTIDAETKKRVKPALKSKRSLKTPPKESDCPFPRRARTRRMSEPPRRFDDRRRDRENEQD